MSYNVKQKLTFYMILNFELIHAHFCDKVSYVDLCIETYT